jgi:hypothetical protein
VLPQVGAGVGFVAAGGYGLFRLEVSADHALVPQSPSIPQSSVSGTFALDSAAARACIALLAGSLEVGPCALLEVGELRATATGDGVVSSGDTNALWLASGLGGLAALRLDRDGHFVVPLHADALVPLEIHRFVIGHVPGIVYELPSFAGRITLEAEVRFW